MTKVYEVEFEAATNLIICAAVYFCRTLLRSWVQIPPSPFLPALEMREQVAGCSKNSRPLTLGAYV
jgi:hypothetical protein